MKIFISWSGELSKLVAKELSEWLPCIIHTVNVFYSEEDIRKGENWDSRLIKELEECNYGIVCLTKENVSAPWVHFEAGAISKLLDSHTSALMIDVVTSDIQGPLSRFQATRLDKDDFYRLVCNINEVSESEISEKVLKKSFDAIWDKMKTNLQNIIKKCSKNNKEDDAENNREADDILEELLQLLRKQDAIINNPSKLFPADHFENLYTRIEKNNQSYALRGLFNFFETITHQIVQFSNNYTESMYLDTCIEMCNVIVDFAKKNNNQIGYNLPDDLLKTTETNLKNLQEKRNSKDDIIVDNEKN